MRLIVGLGNPGPEYEWTPHNLGFLAVDALAERGGIRVTRPEVKVVRRAREMAGQEVILAKPQTMMNLSGVAVRMLLERYECDPAEMIVLMDEVDLPWGMLRIRERGTARHAQRIEVDHRFAGNAKNLFASGWACGRKKFGATWRITFSLQMGRADREIAQQDGRGRCGSGGIDFDRGRGARRCRGSTAACRSGTKVRSRIELMPRRQGIEEIWKSVSTI